MTEMENRQISVPEKSGWGRLRSKTVQWYDPTITAAAGADLSRIEFLRAIRDRALPPAPIAALLGMRMCEVEVGRVVFECEPDESVYNPIGVVHGGLTCTLADTVAACAVQRNLGFGVTSLDRSQRELSPTCNGGQRPPSRTGLVTKPGRRVAFSRADIVDHAGKLVATATSSCLVMDRQTA